MRVFTRISPSASLNHLLRLPLTQFADSANPRFLNTQSTTKTTTTTPFEFSNPSNRASQLHKVPRKTLRNWMKRSHIKSAFPMPIQLRQAAEKSRRKRQSLSASLPPPISPTISVDQTNSSQIRKSATSSRRTAVPVESLVECLLQGDDDDRSEKCDKDVVAKQSEKCHPKPELLVIKREPGQNWTEWCMVCFCWTLCITCLLTTVIFQEMHM